MNKSLNSGKLLVLALGAFALVGCSNKSAEEPAAEATLELVAPTVAAVVPTATTPSEGGVMAIAETGPAVQVLSGIGDSAVFVQGIPATVTLIAADSNGVGSVAITVDGQQWKAWRAEGETVFKTDVEWIPEEVGMHQVGIVVYDVDQNASQLTAYSVTVLPEGSATAVAATMVAASPVPGATPPATPPNADMIPPAVSISATESEIQQGQDFDINTNAVDVLGVVKLELWIGGVVRDSWEYEGSPDEIPQSVFRTLIWRNAGPGDWECYVKAWDNAGNVGQSTTIELEALAGTPTPLTAP